jgi:hypothetical protein
VSYDIENKDTTTTRATADHERDAPGTAEQDDIFSRYLKAAGTAPALDPATAARLQRFAAALGSTPEAVREQGRYRPDILTARLRAVGIEPATGFPMAAHHAEPGGKGSADRLTDALPGDDAPRSPQDAPGAPQANVTGVQAFTGVQDSGGIVRASATTTPTGSPDDVAALGSRLSHGLAAVTAGLLGDDHAEGRTDAEQQRRNEALRAIAAYQRDHGHDVDGMPCGKLT